MNLIQIDYRDRKPIYEQLIDNIKDLVLKDVLKPDEHLPSVRQLAGDLAINPNTIQKAYTELERQGIIYSLQGRGSFIHSDISLLLSDHKAALLEQIHTNLIEARELALPKEVLFTMIDELWRETHD